MKKLALIFMIAFLSGCATHAEIKMPVVNKVHDSAYENKTLQYNILYSQPQPGIVTGGEQQSLTPLEDAELSIASSSTLEDLSALILEQLPASVSHLDNNADLVLSIQIVAHDKKGPAYAEHQFAKSLGKGLLTLGTAPSEYIIIADFDAKYTLEQQGKEAFSKDYKVEELVNHQEGDFDFSNAKDDLTSQILEKHLILTLNDFFTEAAAYVKP